MDYSALTERNAAFLPAAEQTRLARASVLVLGVGGMGGAAVQSLVRAGVGRLAIADGDTFEASNLNRQLFATTRTLGRSKTAATRDALLEINPELTIETLGPEWTEQLDSLLPRFPVVVNAMDDMRAAILLYRKAREHGVTVIDAYTSPCPSVTVVKPHDPRPEERLGFPTVGVPWERIGEAELRQAFLRELAFVVSTSSGIRQLDPTVVGEILAGTRARSSFAPVVMIAGNLMAFEAIQLLAGRASGTDARGYFLNPWSGRVERPRSGPVQRLLTRVALRRLSALGKDGPK
jgi:molybdopterin/thiamine biosynthesis adenylyltransferase